MKTHTTVHVISTDIAPTIGELPLDHYVLLLGEAVSLIFPNAEALREFLRAMGHTGLGFYADIADKART